MASVEKVGPNRWRLVARLGRDPITGKYRKASKTVEAKTKREAERLAHAYETQLLGNRIQGGTTTLRALLDAYLQHQGPDMSPATRRDFGGFVIRYLPAPLLETPISRIGAYELDTLYRHLRQQGGRTGGELAPATVRRVHVVLSAAFSLAVRWSWLDDNPAKRATPPAVPRVEVRLPPAEDLGKLLQALDLLERDRPGSPREGSPLPDFVALLLATGARPGELCALSWRHVDRGRLTIAGSMSRVGGVKTTKTGKARHLRLPATVVELLAQRRAVWAPAALKVGMPLDDLPVFPSLERVEVPWRPDLMSREFRTVRKAAGIDDQMTLRNLRHYVQSVLLAGGVDVNTTARRAGHSSKVLLDVYAHLMDDADVRAAELLDGHVAGLRRLQQS